MHICQDELIALFVILPYGPFLFRKAKSWLTRARLTWRSRHSYVGKEMKSDGLGCQHKDGMHKGHNHPQED